MADGYFRSKQGFTVVQNAVTRDNPIQSRKWKDAVSTGIFIDAIWLYGKSDRKPICRHEMPDFGFSSG